MCGIVGILGREPVAAQLVDALKRLEYRGYDSAGVATLEDGHLDAPARRGQAAQSRKQAGEASRSNGRSASAIPAGRPTAGRTRPTPIRMPPTSVAVVHNGIIENFRELRDELESKGAKFRDRDRHRGRRPSRHRRDEEGPLAGGGGRCRAAAAARRLRARLPVRGRGGPADRRAQGLAARGRLWRRRDVSRLRRHRAGAVHRHDHLSGRRRLGGADAAQGVEVRDVDGASVKRAVRSRPPRRSSSTRATIAISWRRKSTSSRRSSATRSRIISTWRTSACGCRSTLPFDFKQARPHVDLGLRHRLLCRPGRQILVRALRAPAGRDRCRLGIPLPRGAAAAERTCDLRVAIRRDRRHAGVAALRQGARQHVLAVVNVPTSTIARESDVVLPTLAGPGDRRRLDQGLHLPARGAGVPCDRGRPRARRAVGAKMSASSSAR